MISKKNRFTKKEFETFFKKNRRKRSGRYVFIIGDSIKGFAKVAVVCSKKKIKKAVWRNMLRRKIYRVFQEEGVLNDTRSYIVVCQEDLHNTPYDELKGDLLDSLKQISITG